MTPTTPTPALAARVHELKTDPAVFAAVLSGAKTHEIRTNDRGFAVGDALRLRETASTGEQMRAGAPLEYTGREITRTVSHVLTGYGLQDGWCILSLAAQPNSPEFRGIAAQPVPSVQDEWRNLCDQLIDIWDDGKFPEEQRTYVAGAWPDLLAEIRAKLATPSPQIAEKVEPHWYDSPQTALGGKTAREGYAANPEYVREAIAAPSPQMAEVAELPTSNDGKEQDAFEAWATGQKYDMTTHPLHWLFLNERTYAARQGWKAGLEYARDAIAASRRAGGEVVAATLYAECRECSHCGHVGINDADAEKAACHNCDWSGPTPKEDHCPGCADGGCMGAACPKCGAIYKLLAGADLATPAPASAGQAAPALTVDELMRVVRENWGDDAAIERAFRADLSARLAAQPAEGAGQAELDADLRREVAMMYQLLDDGEWAEHIAKTPHGQCLETAITKLVGKASGEEQAGQVAIPDVLFDGHAVYHEVMANEPHTPRVNADQISDVLDAVARLMRRSASGTK